MQCPRCAFEQPEAIECARCGVIVAKYKPPAPPPQALATAEVSEPAPRGAGSSFGRDVALVAVAVGAMALAYRAWSGRPSSVPTANAAAPAGTWRASLRRQPSAPAEPVWSHREPSEPQPPAEGTGAAPTAPEPASRPLRGTVSSSWHTGAAGFAEAEREQQETDAPIALYFYTDWCGYCKRLDRDILSASETQDYLRNVVKVRINPESGGGEHALAGRFGVHGYPSFFMISAPSAAPRKVNPFTPTAGGWRPMSPAEFVDACRQPG